MKTLMLGLFLILTVGCTKKYESYREEGLPPAALADEPEEGKLPPFFQYSDGKGSCSAAAVYANYAVTAAHCVAKGKKYTVTGTGKELRAVYISPQLDRAILIGDFKDRALATIDNSADILHVTPVVIYCGYPGGSKEHSCRQAQRISFDYFMVVFSNTLMPGMSGGPVVDVFSGKLVGIVVAAQRDGAMTATGTVGMFDSAGIKLPE